MHCEATSEKQAMGYFCDGRASLVVGTHTHAPTADHRILPGGTAFMSDVGMTGDYDSVIGMDKDEPLKRFLRKISGARSSRRSARRRCAGSRSRPTTRPGLRGASPRCGSAAGWKRRNPHSGNEPSSRRHPAGVNRDPIWNMLAAGGRPSAPRSHNDTGRGRHGRHVVVTPSFAHGRIRDHRTGLLAGAPVAQAKAPLLNTPAPSFYRFKLGTIEATVVSDGPLPIGDPQTPSAARPRKRSAR